MRLQETSRGIVIDIHVRPNSRQFQVKIENDEIVVFCRETPVKGRVNRELIKGLSRLFKRRVEIVSGLRSRQKKILICGISIEEINGILSTHPCTSA